MSFSNGSAAPTFDEIPTPPPSPQRPDAVADTRPVIVFDFDGTLTPHPGGMKESLYNAFLAHLVGTVTPSNGGPGTDDNHGSAASAASGLHPLTKATLMSDVIRGRIVDAYTAAHVNESEATAITTTLEGLAARGFRILIATHNFSAMVVPYLALFVPLNAIDWKGSIFVGERKIESLLARDGPLVHTPAVVYVDDDERQISQFHLKWREQWPERRLIVHHVGDHWIGRNRIAQRFLAQLTPAFLLTEHLVDE